MDEEIKKLLEKNLELTKDVREMVKKIRRFVIWQQIFGFIKILLIAVPIVLGIIYLPAILEKVLAPYKELLDLQDANMDLKQLSPDLLKGIIK